MPSGFYRKTKKWRKKLSKMHTKDLTGKRFGRLIVLKQRGYDSRRNALWLCACDCGARKLIASNSLIWSKTESCGCYRKELASRTHLGKIDNRLSSSIKPTSTDIAWAAGIYEGEGTCGRHNDSTQTSVAQKDNWILYKLKSFFGGSVIYYKKYKQHRWRLSGARSRGFLMTIYTFLSPRRKTQILFAFGKKI